MTFPIILACTIKVKNELADFKPEYIIPQLLLELVSRNESVDGIKFISTKVDYKKIDNVPAYNYVFPIKQPTREGLCKKLVSCFHTTSPTSWAIEQLIDSGSANSYIENKETGEIAIIDDNKSNYLLTSFGQLELKLKDREVKKIL